MKISATRTRPVLIFTGCIISFLVFSYLIYKQSILEDPVSIAINTTLLPFPVHLKIPKININASIEDVDITADGAMDVPKQPDDVAWFDLGPRPGSKGNAVIDGHSGWKDNKPAVFDDLYKLQKGDKIYVEDNKGVNTIFVVQGFKTYYPDEDASSVFSSNDDKAHLNLITCSGAWSYIQQTHSTRLVVFANQE